MLSAHGSAPEVVEAARASGGAVVNAVCPLVTKVHHEVKLRASKGYSIVYVGHEGHEEAVATMAVAPGGHAPGRERGRGGGPARARTGPVAFLAQTTLAVDEWRSILEAAQQRWPDLWVPGRSDLCFATTNRQTALRAIAGRCDAMVVIGSANSSNTLALVRTARAAGCPRVLRVNRAAELPDDLAGMVGVIAGASAPESLVEEVLERLAPAERDRRGARRARGRVLPAAPGAARGAPVGGGRPGGGGVRPARNRRATARDSAPLDGRDVPAAKVLATLDAD